MFVVIPGCAGDYSVNSPSGLYSMVKGQLLCCHIMLVTGQLGCQTCFGMLRLGRVFGCVRLYTATLVSCVAFAFNVQ